MKTDDIKARVAKTQMFFDKFGCIDISDSTFMLSTIKALLQSDEVMRRELEFIAKHEIKTPDECDALFDANKLIAQTCLEQRNKILGELK